MNATMQRKSSVRWMAAMACEKALVSSPAAGGVMVNCAAGSTSQAIRCIICTACTGYLPTADSPESMTASVPSRMALATSLASARVGRGSPIMLSCICVAVMTGKPR